MRNAVVSKKNIGTIQSDERYMGYALRLAHKAYQQQEVPIGCVVVDATGAIIGRGYNRTEHYKSQQQHAELRALAQATRKIGDWRLYHCTIYVTLEPCLMCLYAILLSRCAGLVYGAQSPLYGYHLDKNVIPQIYTKHIVRMEGGVRAHESEMLLKKFFGHKRGEVFYGSKE
jgi:tRNA(adenine34) deaminase